MRLSPFRIAAIYLIVATLWIISTDSLLELIVTDQSLFSFLNSTKGVIFVVLTAGGLLYLLKIYEGELKAEEKKLRDKDKSLTLALESNKMATWEYYPDSDQYVTSSNHNSLFDLPESHELSLKDVLSRLHPDDLEPFKQQVNNSLEKARDFNMEYRVVYSDESVHWLWTRGSIQFSNGQIESVTGITSDITVDKTLKKKLDLEKEKFEVLFDKIPVLITVYNPNLNINEVNREFLDVLGWSDDELYSNHALELLYPDDDIRQTAYEHMSNPGQGWKEFEIRTKSGDIRHQIWSNIQLSDSTIVGIGHDITRNKRLEAEEKESHERLIDVFNNLPIFINIFDESDNVIDCNEFTTERLGYEKEELLHGDLIKKLVGDEETFQKAMSHIGKADHTWVDFDIVTKGGEKLKTRWMNMVLNKSIKLGVGIDLTEQKDLEEQLTLAVRGGNVGLWDYYPNEKKTLINDVYAQMLGYSREELEPRIHRDWEELTYPDDLEDTMQLLQEHFKGETSAYEQEMRMKHKDGHWVWVLTRGVVAERDEDGNVVRVTGTNSDITERKQLEEQIKRSQTRLKQATTSANIGLWEWNPQTGDVVIDEIWANLVGYELEELEPISIETWNSLVHPDDLIRFEEAVDDYFSGKTDIYEIEIRMRHKEGHWVWILDRGRNIEWDNDGKPIKMIGTHVDITNLKLNEKRLEESEQLLLETQKVANLGTFTEDLKTGELYTSKILNKMFWLQDGESLTSDKLVDRLHPDFKYVADIYKRKIRNGDPFESEFKIQNKKTKRERWIYERATVELNKEGDPVRVIGVMLDVSRTKEQELRIKRTLAQLRKAEEIAEIGYWEKNLETGRVYWGDNKYSLFDADPAQGPISRQEFFQRLHPDDRKKTYDAYVKAENMNDLDVSFRYKLNNGTYRTFREKAELVQDDMTGHNFLRGVTMDITSIKSIESQLEDEQTRMNIISGLISDVIWEWNFEYDTISWSEGMESTFGYELDKLPAGEDSWVNHIHPDDRERIEKSIRKARESDQTEWEEEYRFLDKSGKVRYVRDQGVIFRDESGKAQKMVGAMIDQTESKESEQILSDQAQLLEDISDAVIAIDENSHVVSWNRAAEIMYGWSEQEAIGKDIGQLIRTDHSDNSNEELFSKLLEENEWSGEVIQFNRLDEPMSIMSSVRMIADQDGNFDGAVAVNKDITAIKKIQEKLSYEQRRFEYATSVVSDAIWDANPSDNSLWWSEGLETHYKHPVPSREKGYLVWKDNLHPDDKERVLSTMKHAEDSGATQWEQQYRFIRGDGSVATVLDRAFILRDDEGDILRIIGAMNDITIEKEAERDLKRSEEQYRLLYEESPLPMYIFDKQSFRFLSVNKALVELFGYSKDEFLEMTIFELFLPEEEEKIKQEAFQNLKKTHTGFDIWRQITKNGSVLHCEISGSDIFFKDKQQRLVLTLDITEQRKADERAIKAIVEGEERERHRIANELHDGLGQYLSAANMHLNSVFSDSDDSSEQQHRSFRTGLQMLEYAISETRSISHNLLPKAIQDYGLKMAVESLVNEMQSTQDISIHLFQKYDDDHISGNIQINIFRIIQEALNNALKHSGGSIININLVYSDKELICTVEDNGSGFDPSNVESEGLGLQSMKTRVAAMSGNLDIDSDKKSGTLITAIVPLK